MDDTELLHPRKKTKPTAEKKIYRHISTEVSNQDQMQAAGQIENQEPWSHLRLEREPIRDTERDTRKAKNRETDHPGRDERGCVICAVGLAVIPAAATAAHGAADRGRRCGAVLGEQAGAPHGAVEEIREEIIRGG